jgi:hypothetical protein
MQTLGFLVRLFILSRLGEAMQIPFVGRLSVVLLLAASSLLQAQGDPSQAGKSWTPTAMSMGAPDASSPLGAAWQRFVTADPDGTWWSRWSPATGTPKEIYGSGLPLANWGGDTIEEARRHAAMLLHDQSELLALGTSEFREVIGARMGQTWAFVYEQYYRGLPVIDGRVDVRVHGVGRIPMFGSTAWQIPDNFVTVPRIAELEATRIAWQQVGIALAKATQPGAVRNPRLVIWGDVLSTTLAPVSLAWEIPISNVDANGQGPIGRYYIDAATGLVLNYTSDKHDCGSHDHGHEGGEGGEAKSGADSGPAMLAIASGTVMAYTRVGLQANSPLVNVPVVGAAVITTQGTVFTDASGNYSINLNIFIPFATATFSLDGVHNQAILGSNSPVFSLPITTGYNGIAQLQAPTDLEAAHTSTYYWIYKVNEFCRSVLGNTTQLDTANNIVPTVNIAQTCNAYYSGNTVNFYHAGGSCRNTAFSTVVTHEWGHGLDDRYGGISNSSGDGLSEGWGDIVAMYCSDTAIVGDNFYTSGGDIRNGNNTTLYPPPSEVHAAGEVWMGFAWQLRERLAGSIGRPNAITVTNSIVLGSIVADATNQLGALLQVFVADDNDGNLANATPHSTELAWACGQKNYPYPLGSPPSNDECSGAYQVYNGVNGTYSNELALNSSPGFQCSSLGTKDVWFRYLAGNGPLTVSTCTQATWDTEIEVLSGSCGALTSIGCNDDACSLQSSVTVNITTPGYYYIRVGGFNNHSGTFSLDVNGTAGNLASWYSYGPGCNNVSKAFYELFSAPSFDLNLSTLRMVPSGGSYLVAPGGSYHVPAAGATALALGDDSEVTVPITGVFNYPGGSTSALTICSNGFVSVATGNGTGFSPNGATWVNSVRPRWGTWHDFNPSIVGSGAVKFEQIGSTVYVTWDGVYDFLSTNPNIWQLQFNLSTSSVTFVWPAMSGSGNSLLVGYAPGGANPDAGSRDLSLTMPFNSSTSNTFALALAGALPTLGSNVPMVTTYFPAASSVGAIVESLVQVNPGVSLASSGMPNCFAYVGSPSVVILLIPSAGAATFNQSIPNAPAFMGVLLAAQSYAFAPGANVTGVIASNGVALRIGF